MQVKLTSGAYATLLNEAEKAAPAECCGLLLGPGAGQAHITEIRPAANVADDPLRRFEIDPAALLLAHRQARSGGAAIIGYYHSHPKGHPMPSATDCEHASGDGKIWAIIAGGGVTFWRDVAQGGDGGFEALSSAVIDG